MAELIDMHIDYVPYIIAACRVLHYVCVIHGDSFEVDLEQPNDQPSSTASSGSRYGGDTVREALMEYFGKENHNRLALPLMTFKLYTL